MSSLHPNFEAAIERVDVAMKHQSRKIHTDRWQGINIKDRPEAEMVEILNWDFRVPMTTEDLDRYRLEIKPNLPWADDHFDERVCGEPINPGKEWANWPYAQSAQNFLDANGKFEVNYMERYWASQIPDVHGIRGRRWGDLEDIVRRLADDPLTRQAWLPIYFPEDTASEVGRVPCSLGYHWIMRGGFLHVFYPIRSCDYLRHFRDDIYLTIRLTLWLLQQLREIRPKPWDEVKPGYFSMWIGSLHLFVNDYIKLYGKPQQVKS